MHFMPYLSMLFCLLFMSCSKDKNMEDYRRDQLGQSLARITSVSGVYTGSLISKIDHTNLGTITLKFQARTDIQSGSGAVSNSQNAIINGSLNFSSLSLAEISFDNGFYDDVTGEFQVTIPISKKEEATSKLYLFGKVDGNKWDGTIEVKGQPEFGGELHLLRNAPLESVAPIEVGGVRLQQIKKLNYFFMGTYQSGEETTPFKMSFIDRDILPEQSFYKLFSPVRNINVNCDFSYFELNFADAILDDKAGTLVAHDPVDQSGVPARANLNCLKFQEEGGDFGWDCEIQTKVRIIHLHLSAKK